jgi:hypothetical protein
MSVSAVSSGGAYGYLQSLLQQQSSTNGAGTSDPLASLLETFYPNGTSAAPNSATTPTSTTTTADLVSAPTIGNTQFSSNTLGTLISLQSQQSWTDPIAAKAQSVFSEFDTNGDGSISKSEFENVFGSNADMSKVDGLFSALDTNGDGSISQSELTSAAQQSQAQHPHHDCDNDMDNSGSGGANDPLASLMSATQGASSATTSNSDGSTSTTITYADGTTVTMNVPAASSSNQTPNNGSGSQNTAYNVLEQLIQLQAQMLAQSASTIAPTIPAI